jgi:hypothetical protein
LISVPEASEELCAAMNPKATLFGPNKIGIAGQTFWPWAKGIVCSTFFVISLMQVSYQAGDGEEGMFWKYLSVINII